MTSTQRPSRSPEATARHQRGLELLRDNQAARSIAELERAVELDPASAEFHKSLGNARRSAGDLEGALASYRRSLEIAPDFLPARYNLGLVLCDLNRPQEAEAEFRRVHESDPRDADVLFQLALLASARGDRAESVRLLQSAAALAPADPYVRFHLALAYRELPDRTEAAIECLRDCIRLKPDFADAHHLLADIMKAGARFEEATAHYRDAVRLAPRDADAHTGLGDVLLRQHRLEEAIAAYRAALAIDPALAAARFNLGTAHGLAGAHDQAIGCYETALKLSPDNASAMGLLLFEMQRVCDWSRLDELARTVREAVRERPDQEIHPFGLLCLPSTSEEQLACAKNYAAFRTRAVARDRDRLRFPFERRDKPRLRIGYLSFDFREHPGAHLMADLVEIHDRGGFEILAYSYGVDDGSAVRARLVRAFDRFVDIRSLSHADAATRIHADQVDIVVNCTGYTAYNRTEINALRPAPVQVNFLGYPGTMGADFMDYIVTDRFVTPPGSEAFLSEQPVYMPASYQVNGRRPPAATLPRGELGLPPDRIVYCCFNQVSKIDPLVFSAWTRILQAVPESVLWLYDQNRWSTANLRREARARGIAEDRLIFAPRCSLDRYLAHLRAADLFLDTLHYNAHTTASDALWAGTPIVTCAGSTFPSRVAGSLLKAVGLPELVTHSLDAYEALAVALSRDPRRRASLREKLDRERATAPLFDTAAYARHLESAYRQMWRLFLEGSAPRPIQP